MPGRALIRAALACLMTAATGMGQLPAGPGKWILSAAADKAGYKVEMRHDGAVPCAVIVPPAATPSDGANLTQLFSAKAYRGKTIRLSAWLRVEMVQPTTAQLWMRVDRPKQGAEQAMNLFDNLSDQPVRAGEWTRSEVTLNVNRDADAVSFGVLSRGSAAVWVKEVALAVVGGEDSVLLSAGPRNLGFMEGSLGMLPTGWRTMPASLPDGAKDTTGYRARTTTRGCSGGPACALLSSTGAPLTTWGTLTQTFDANSYRGKTVKLRALIRLQPDGDQTRARLWMRMGRASESVDSESVFEHMDYREIQSKGWTETEIVRKVDADVDDIAIGVMLLGKGRVWIDLIQFAEVHVEALPDAPASTPPLTLRMAVPEAPLVDPGPVRGLAPLSVIPPGTTQPPPPTNWLALPPPEHEEQRQVINAASRNAANYIRELPNFLCTLSIHRAENRGGGWKARDFLTVQLGFADGKEHYRLVAVDRRPTTAPYRSVGGAISEGDFGGVPADIFRPNSAQFHWDHWANLRDHVVHVFRYEVSQSKSGYQLQYGLGKGKPVSTVSAHHGYVYIEKDTNLLFRIEQTGDPPGDFPVKAAGTVIDYDWNDVGGTKYLLPLKAEITMASPTLRTINLAEFRDYRKFGADSQITFDPP